MRKIVIAVLLFCISISFCVSEEQISDIGDSIAETDNQSSTESENIIHTIQKMLEEDLLNNKDKLIELTKNLSLDEKQKLYLTYEKSGGKYFVLNLILGCGIGSFAQGDSKSGMLALCFELGGVVMMLSGTNSENAFLVSIGYGLLIGGRVGECIAPWEYANNYNDTLKTSLNMTYEKLSFVPVINPIDEKYGFVARIAL